MIKVQYKIIRSSTKDIALLKEYKKKTIYEYAKGLSDNEIANINNYIDREVHTLLENYYNIIVNNKIIGCLMLTEHDDGKLLGEFFIEEAYRNQKIGTSILKNIINDNNHVYLWVYKENIKALSLYKRLGFKIKEETETRYYMEYSNNPKNCLT